ncbi:hypothetical protein [Blastomonas sp. CCH5-E3]|jgi:hypothetical protein|nr:hypothetical protein [Blastomonas sp. CCH5-E3]
MHPVAVILCVSVLSFIGAGCFHFARGEIGDGKKRPEFYILTAVYFALVLAVGWVATNGHPL